MKHRRWLFLLFCLTLGVAISAFTLPLVQNELAIRKLFSADASKRHEAHIFFERQRGSHAALTIRLRDDPDTAHKIIARLADARADEVFVDVVAALHRAGWWTPDQIPLEIWLRRCKLQLATGSDQPAIDVIDELRVLPLDHRTDDVRDAWLTVIQWPHSPVVRELALFEAASWWGPIHAQDIIAPALHDKSPRLRRFAWLFMGHLAPQSGYVANWADESPDVALATLWAATIIDPDHAQPLLEAVDSDTLPAGALEYLLSRSHDPDARARLESRALDGQNAAAYHLAGAINDPATLDPGITSALAQGQAAWLGLLDPESLVRQDQIALARWSAWRRSAGHSMLITDPVASDGSIWATVLLAQRILDPDHARVLADEWVNSIDNQQRCAGVYLAALLRTRSERNDQIIKTSLVDQLRRYARLARLFNAPRPIPPHASDLAYAWRLLDEADAADEPTQPALIALLSAGDTYAATWILDPSLSIRHPAPAQCMLQYAWLIEKFFPQCIDLVGIPCPFDDDVAALQFDVLRTGMALSQRSNRFASSTGAFNVIPLGLTSASQPDRP